MVNPLQLTGKRILVTGASSGIGRACAQLISQLGGEVVLVARDLARLQQTKESLSGGGHTIEVFDLAEVDGIQPWLKGVAAQRDQGLSGVVHCAGVLMTRAVQTTKISDYERLMRLNVTSAFALAQGFRQRTVCSKPGCIVLISSVSAFCGNSGMAAYSTSKAALLGMTRSLAIEFAIQQIRVNCICAGLVDTEMVRNLPAQMTQAQIHEIEAAHPLGLGSANDVAHSAAFLLAETGRWITGATLVVDGGYSAR